MSSATFENIVCLGGVCQDEFEFLINQCSRKIFLFDPIQNSYKKSVIKQRKIKNLEVFNLALSESDGSSEYIQMSPYRLSGIFELDKHRTVFKGARKTGVILVDSISLKSLVNKIKLDSKRNLLIVNLSVTELMVLEGAGTSDLQLFEHISVRVPRKGIFIGLESLDVKSVLDKKGFILSSTNKYDDIFDELNFIRGSSSEIELLNADIDRHKQEIIDLKSKLFISESKLLKQKINNRDLRKKLRKDSGEKCEMEIDQLQKPVIRLIHHFACTGGTLISKCISALPNVFLLSEVHPYSNLHLNPARPKYLPSDIISLAKQACVIDVEELSDEIIQYSISSANKHVEKNGGILVLRDHSHSDFCVNKLDSAPNLALVRLLESKFTVQSLITIRNPIDSFLSLNKNGWRHFEPFNFDEYCRRICLFLEAYNHCNVVCYEDLVKMPERTMRQICDYLVLPYDESFKRLFGSFNVSGDSGRTGTVIAKRLRETMSDDFIREINESEYFKKIEKVYYG